MLNKSSVQLTDYQRAILTEVGVTYWQFRDPNKVMVEADNQTAIQPSHGSELISKAPVKSPQDALLALQQLKEDVLTVESTDKVLLALSHQEIKSELVSDVLTALGLEDKACKSVPADQLAQFKDYPLSWQQGDNLTLNDNQLCTGSLSELNRPEMKKQLWQLIQQRLNATT
jgi:DNA polymerase III psi subunit